MKLIFESSQLPPKVSAESFRWVSADNFLFVPGQPFLQSSCLSRSKFQIMIKPFYLYCIGALFSLILAGCEDDLADKVPTSFRVIEVHPDDIYLYNNGGNPYGVRLDPLINDSIKVDVSVSYTVPTNGTITFIENEGWFYKPNADFIGIDKITYSVCNDDECHSALITMYVEEPIDPDNCAFQINGESIETKKGQPIAIRIFENDFVCPYQGSSLAAPEKGRFDTFSYSGSFKNIVYVYFPPEGFVGTDRFTYKLFTSDGFLEAYCDITITE